MPARGPPAPQAERAARRGDNTAGFPRDQGVRALWALRLRGGGGGELGSAGKLGRARPGAPRGAAPAGRESRAAPRERKRETGKEAKWSPFVLLAPHCWLLRAAGPHLPPPPSLPRRARPAKVAAGRGPRAGAGLAGHFLCPAALPRAPLPPPPPSREPGPPASPARAALFGWGEPERKSFAGGAGEGAPRAAGTRRGAATAGPPRSPPPRAPRPRESAFLSLPRALPSAPGQVGLRRAGAGARRGLSPAGGPAAWPVARSPRSALVPGGRGPGSSARSLPAAATHTHTRARVYTLSSASLFAAADGHGHRACVCGRVPIPLRPRVLFRRQPKLELAPGVPVFSNLQGKGEIFRRNLACSASLRGGGCWQWPTSSSLAYWPQPSKHPSGFFFPLFSFKDWRSG